MRTPNLLRTVFAHSLTQKTSLTLTVSSVCILKGFNCIWTSAIYVLVPCSCFIIYCCELPFSFRNSCVIYTKQYFKSSLLFQLMPFFVQTYNPMFTRCDPSNKHCGSALWEVPKADDWELPSPSILLTDEQPLGEGCFGTVHRGVVKGPILHSRTMKNTICMNVTVKFLKSESQYLVSLSVL